MDSLVEDVHFKKEWFSIYRLGIKSMAVNLSDIAAMGGTPQFALLALNTGKLSLEETKELLEGINYEAKKYSVDIIGGNISSSREIGITITLLGKAKKPILRSGARPGDLVVVTGTIGDASAGLYKLSKGAKNQEDQLIRKFISPEPKIEEGKLIARFATSMIDISDGLQLDLWRIKEASKTGVLLEVDSIPRSNDFLKFLEEEPAAKEKVFWGGEDYELLFTIPEYGFKELLKIWKFKTTLTVIGEIISGNSFLIYHHGKKQEINSPSGWIHK